MHVRVSNAQFVVFIRRLIFFIAIYHFLFYMPLVFNVKLSSRNMQKILCMCPLHNNLTSISLCDVLHSFFCGKIMVSCFYDSFKSRFMCGYKCDILRSSFAKDQTRRVSEKNVQKMPLINQCANRYFTRIKSFHIFIICFLARAALFNCFLKLTGLTNDAFFCVKAML